MSETGEELDAAVAPAPGNDEPTIRERVREALGDEPFAAAVVRRTDGIPTDPDASEERYESVDALPDEPFDQSAIRTELLAFSEPRVYRWVAAGGSVERTVLPRTPAAAGGD